MTISQDFSAPLVAVVGATGVQGGSVIKALLDSSKPYRIRALSITLENAKEVVKAFTGADVVFLVTNFFEHLDADRETAEGKMMIDAAKSACVTAIVWSGLPNCAKISNGKYTHAAVVSEYGRQCGSPIQRKDDGSFAMIVPVGRRKPCDYGLRRFFPDGEEFRTGEYLTLRAIAAQAATGKRIVVEQIPLEMFREAIATKMPPHIVLDFFYGGKPISGLEGERQPVTLKRFAAEADWSQVLASS
ncbi:NmrA domain-containing protein [Favolaschia claudopus]|uniref:NmrA domain-containing protein n=1 Tax=Favolaschia claudopus TaxID=2862362 RepID=A0AAW0CQ43_9AGAR